MARGRPARCVVGRPKLEEALKTAGFRTPLPLFSSFRHHQSSLCVFVSVSFLYLFLILLIAKGPGALLY
jgi:hypothetical protein